MKISAICCVWRREDFERWTLPTIAPIVDEIVEVASKSSLFAAYNRGAQMAKHDVKIFIHDDVELHHPFLLRERLEAAFCEPDVGLFGVIGSKTLDVTPWWHNEIVGEAWHGIERSTERFGNRCDGPTEVESLDGLLIAMNGGSYWWPEEEYANTQGFHYYDTEICWHHRHELKKRIIVDDCGKVGHHCKRKGRVNTAEHMWAGQVFEQRRDVKFLAEDHDMTVLENFPMDREKREAMRKKVAAQ